MIPIICKNDVINPFYFFCIFITFRDTIIIKDNYIIFQNFRFNIKNICIFSFLICILQIYRDLFFISKNCFLYNIISITKWGREKESIWQKEIKKRGASYRQIILRYSPLKRQLSCWILSICDEVEIEYPDVNFKASQRGSTSSWNKHALCRSSHQIQLRCRRRSFSVSITFRQTRLKMSLCRARARVVDGYDYLGAQSWL